MKDHLIGQDIDGTMSGISGGERRRVSVGISLVTDALAIFLDEPTTGLDSESAEQLMQLLSRLANNRGKTVRCSPLRRPHWRHKCMHSSIAMELATKGLSTIHGFIPYCKAGIGRHHVVLMSLSTRSEER